MSSIAESEEVQPLQAGMLVEDVVHKPNYRSASYAACQRAWAGGKYNNSKYSKRLYKSTSDKPPAKGLYVGVEIIETATSKPQERVRLDIDVTSKNELGPKKIHFNQDKVRKDDPRNACAFVLDDTPAALATAIDRYRVYLNEIQGKTADQLWAKWNTEP